MLNHQAFAFWTYLNPKPAPGDIIDVDFVDNQNGFILTDAGIVLKTTDGGEDWTILNNPNAQTGVFDIDFINPQWGWILCGNDPNNRDVQFIDYTRDGGNSWDTYSVGSEETPAMLNCIEYRDDIRGWAGGETVADGNLRYAIFRFVNGDSWEPMILPQGRETRLNDIFFQSNNFGWVVGDNGYSAYTMDGGREWFLSDPVTNDHLYSVHFSGPMDGWAVGGGFDRGVILRSTDAGESWSVSRELLHSSRMCGVYATDSQHAIAITEGLGLNPGQIYSTSDGENWALTFEFLESQILLCMSNIEQNIWLGGLNGSIFASGDHVNWRSLGLNWFRGDCYDIYSFGQFAFVGGDHGELYRSMNSGRTWEQLETGSDWRILNLHFDRIQTGFITGANSTELYTEDGGESWEEVDISDVDVNLITINENFGYATHGQFVAVTRDNGRNWESSEVIRGDIPASALSVPTQDIAYVASAGDTLRRTVNAGESWHPVRGLMGESFGVCFIDANTGWAIAPSRGQGIRLYKTENGGSDWESGFRFTLAPGGVLFTDEENGWIWENPGKIYHTEDGGDTWEDTYLRVNRIIRSLYSDNNDRLWICGDDGLIAVWNRFEVSAPIFSEPTPTGFVLTSLYPNPTNSALNLNISITKPGDYQITLLDLTGRQITTSHKIFPTGGTHPVSMHLTGLPAGAYWVNVSDGVNWRGRSVVLVK